jgi:VanZ family protein
MLVGDEFHQSFIVGRGASVIDVIIDSAGVITGIFVMILLILMIEFFASRFKKTSV